MKQRELAEKLGCSPKHLSNVITGKVRLTDEFATKLQAVLGIPAIYWGALEYEYRSRLANGGVLWVDVMDKYMGPAPPRGRGAKIEDLVDLLEESGDFEDEE